MFNERLKKYRESLNLTKREFAEKLEVGESNYNMIENAKRPPSKIFMHKLVAFSEKPEEYWLYGVNDQEYTTVREDFKSTRKAVMQLLELGLLDDVNKLFKDSYKEGTIEELVRAALITDLEYLKNKYNK